MLAPGFTASVKRAALRFAVKIGYHSADVGEHEVIAAQETTLEIPLAQHYHLVSLGKDGSVPFLLDFAPRIRLSAIRHNGNQA